MGRRQRSTPRNHADNLPEDVVFGEILPKVPAESLVRLKCVSKTWYDQITNNSRFISTHLLHHSQKSKHSIFLARHRDDECDCRLFLLLNESKVLDLDISYITKTIQPKQAIDIVGSCNGLLLLSLLPILRKNLILWNPATREFRELPDPVPSQFDVYEESANLGFGFDETSKDYTVIRIVQLSVMIGVDGILDLLSVQLFTKRSDYWRKLSRLEGYKLWGQRSVVVVKGNFYWLAKDMETNTVMLDNFCVFSFSLGREELAVIKAPDSYAEAYDERRHYEDFEIAKWKEYSLGIVAFSLSGHGKWYFDFWLLIDDIEGGLKWTKLFKISPSFRQHWRFCGVCKDQFLIERIPREKNGQLLLCSPNSYGRKKINGGKRNRKRYGTKLVKLGQETVRNVHEYVPSLVSVYPNQKVKEEEKKRKLVKGIRKWVDLFKE